MLGKVYSGAVSGIDGVLICVESDISNGLPQFEMIGLLEKSVSEARERVRTALKNSGVYLLPNRYTINLSPADQRKQGNGFDLPIAVSVMIAMGLIEQKETDGAMFLGELGLDGALRPIDGCLTIVNMARQNGFKKVFVPYDNRLESSIVDEIDILPVKSLKEVIEYFQGTRVIDKSISDAKKLLEESNKECVYDFADINGQYMAKRAAEVAAAGLHNILLVGPPGSGKTMLAKRMPGILPALTIDEAINITNIYSICGLLPRDKALICERPFRNPHHTTSMQALVGGGSVPKPGEVSLASNGILFLDELPEFNKSTLEVLRQPLEDGEIVLSRVQATYRFPAACQLVAAMNPCSCGYYPDRSKCHCSEADVSRYLGKISRPLLDRIDICIEVPKLKYDDIRDSNKSNESSLEIRKRVMRAVEIQKERYKNEIIDYNSQLTPKLINKYCKLGKNENELLKVSFEELNLSARAYHRIIKVSRTIADLSESMDIMEEHICEALSYRSFERQVWK